MVVIDGNEVGGEDFRARGVPSPALHPAMQSAIDALAARDDLDLEVVCASTRIPGLHTEQREGYRFTSVPASRSIPGMGAGMIGRLLALRNYLRQTRPDLVHGQGTEREAALAAVLSGRPSVVTLHGNFREISKFLAARRFDYFWCAAKLETFALRRAGAILCISNYVREITACFGKPQFLIPNPVAEKFLRAEPVTDKPRPRIICMGTIDVRKRTSFILEACERLWREGLDFDLAVYGGSPWNAQYYNDFQARLKPWQERGLATYGFHTPTPELAIASADIMVSASCEESFGMNVLEAMAVGIPVVAPRVGGIVDLVRDGKEGFLYPVESLDSCIDALRKLLTDGELRRELGTGGKLRAQSQFSLSRVAELTIAAYKQVVQPAVIGKR